MLFLRVGVLVISLVLCLQNALADFGVLKVNSYLNQPFSAQVDLNNVQLDSVDNIKVVSSLTQPISNRLVVTSNTTGVLYITSQQPIDVAAFEMELSANLADHGFLQKNYPVFLDPAAQVIQQTQTQLNQGQYGPIKMNETLSMIGAKLKPHHVHLATYMKSLFNANPNAFLHHDPNQIMAGSMLTLPDQNAHFTSTFVPKVIPAKPLVVLHPDEPIIEPISTATSEVSTPQHMISNGVQMQLDDLHKKNISIDNQLKKIQKKSQVLVDQFANQSQQMIQMESKIKQLAADQKTQVESSKKEISLLKGRLTRLQQNHVDVLTTASSGEGRLPWLIILALVIVFGGAGYWYYRKKMKTEFSNDVENEMSLEQETQVTSVISEDKVPKNNIVAKVPVSKSDLPEIEVVEVTEVAQPAEVVKPKYNAFEVDDRPLKFESVKIDTKPARKKNNFQMEKL